MAESSLLLRGFARIWNRLCASSEGQGAHPRTPSQPDAAARPEATLPGPETSFNGFNGACVECGENEDNCRCDEEFFEDLDCTHCCGDGICDDGADPLWDCPPEAHFCHACGGSGNRRDQRIF